MSYYYRNSKLVVSLLRKDQGMTLIELIIVTVFVALFAAVGLPNFLRQVGKARNTEFKHAIGTINRSQQAYHWEKNAFALGATAADTLEMLNIEFDNKYIDTYIFSITGTSATIVLTNNDDIDETKGYSGGMYFDSATGRYAAILCESLEPAATTGAPVDQDTCAAGAQAVF